jgi:hypothetical protein
MSWEFRHLGYSRQSAARDEASRERHHDQRAGDSDRRSPCMELDMAGEQFFGSSTSAWTNRPCTIPEPAMFSGTWDKTQYAMEVRILRALLSFGLLEERSETIPNSPFREHRPSR